MDASSLVANLEQLGEQPIRLIVAFDSNGPQSEDQIRVLLTRIDPTTKSQVTWFNSLQSASIEAPGRCLAEFLRRTYVVTASLDE